MYVVSSKVQKSMYLFKYSDMNSRIHKIGL